MNLKRLIAVVGGAAALGAGQGKAPPAEQAALRRAIVDLSESFPRQYRQGAEYLRRLDRVRTAAELEALRREALLANPLLDFDKLLVIRRGAKNLGLPQNWDSNEHLPAGDYDNEIAILSPVGGEAELRRLYRPADGGFVGDLNLNFDARHLLFSMRAASGRFQVFELETGGGAPRQLRLIEEPDVDNFEGCYMPSGDIVFSSTAPFIGVPCVVGRSYVSQLYRWEAGSGKVRRLSFGQDHDWCPTVLEDGRLLYLRWEYADIPHYVSRILFSMNPDGTGQMEYYGSNSYWPNSMFYAKPIPGQPTRFVAVVGGHHGAPRMGELVLFDTALGRREADGVIQRIPGYGKKVEPIIKDQLVDDSWPKFLHPYPLSDKYFLVSAKPTPESDWGIYLVDVFDNLLLVKSAPGYALLEPVPLRARARPPVVTDRVDYTRRDALVILQDIYRGRGLEGVPRGTVKQLRLVTFHFAYQGMGGEQNRVGMDGPWDVRRVMGTVPVEADGSAYFRIPASVPVMLQPLDGEGKAIQYMRSWLNGMPGETVSCVGCHERQNTAPAPKMSLALKRAPSRIRPWYGPERGFSFNREVQPVLERYCVGCHDGRGAGGRALPDFRRRPDVHPEIPGFKILTGTRYPPAYLELRRYVRAATLESDMRGLPAYEFHADASKLVQLLHKGHYGVKLDGESWDRLITWIDLNTPAQGTWHEIVGWDLVRRPHERRREMQKRYAELEEDDPEAEIETVKWAPMKTVALDAVRPAARPPERGPATAVEAGGERTVELGQGITLKLRYAAPGEFVMGDENGYPDERPARRVRMERGFWIGQLEISNEQYALFDPRHDSFLEVKDFLQFSVEGRGDPVNQPRQPVCRVSWERAAAYCRWLSKRTGESFRLPEEAEWEYAARAGTVTPMWYGGTGEDFSKLANLADYRLKFGFGRPAATPHLVAPYRPAITEVDDNFKVSAPVGSFRPNPWGLFDVHGNVAEWTASTYKPYGNSAEGWDGGGRKVVRGGSWADCPKEARAGSRRAYHAWQGVFDVGFRVVSDGANGKP